MIITTAPEGEDEQQAKVLPLADPNTVSGAKYYKPDQWNDYAITARGEHAIDRIKAIPARRDGPGGILGWTLRDGGKPTGE